MEFKETALKLEDEILDGDELRQRLQFALPQAKENIVFISAYITQNAIDWLIKLIPDNVNTYMICRLLPLDVMAGATQLSALKTALANGIKVSCLHSLHAKIYAIDSKVIYIGSANLTNNGLKIYGAGNIEACLQVPANNLNLNFINKIVESATALDDEIIQNMQGCIDLKEANIFLDRWPEGVLNEEEGIWVRDFFWTQPGAKYMSLEQIHDFELLGIESSDGTEEVTEEQILKTRCVKWLIKKLEIEPNKELFFGTLTKILQEELKDDPAPYRKDVKLLLQNLLEYVDVYLQNTIEISTPRYSQKIKLM